MATYAHNKIVPDGKSSASKKTQVAEMFNAIAGNYDITNRFLSGGIDKRWRKKALNELKNINPKNLLDVATGTGDVAIMAYHILKPQKITGIDIAEGMLELGRKKVEHEHLENRIELLRGDGETINSDADTFDAITVAFGVRNFQDLERGLLEMHRVLKQSGKAVILEFSKPRNIFFKALYNLYMKFITPLLGKFFTKNKHAYEYLNNSINAFPDREAFIEVMNKSGFVNTYFKPLSLGICCIYCGSK